LLCQDIHYLIDLAATTKGLPSVIVAKKRALGNISIEPFLAWFIAMLRIINNINFRQ
jgi:hypothetical protein